MQNPEILPPRDEAEIFIVDISQIGSYTQIEDEQLRLSFTGFLDILLNISQNSEFARNIDNAFNRFYKEYVTFYNNVPITFRNSNEFKSGGFKGSNGNKIKVKDLFITPDQLSEILTDIREKVKEGDLIRFVTPLYRTDIFFYISYEKGKLILYGLDEYNVGLVLPGVSIAYLSRNNLNSYDKINKEYLGANIIGIKAPSNGGNLQDWKNAKRSFYLENHDGNNYVRYKNFEIYLGEEIAPFEDEEFDDSQNDEFHNNEDEEFNSSNEDSDNESYIT